MSNLPKNALITGALGFTGRYMADELRRHGYQVTGLGSQAGVGQDYCQVDLTDSSALAACMARLQPDVVVHLAAVAFVQHGDANAFYQTNIIGTRNLLEALVATGKSLDCVLLASSANVYGNATAGLLSEATLPLPANDYAVSKLAMEHMASLWMERLPIVIARPFNYTGVGQAENFLLPKIVAHFRRHAPGIELGNLDVWRDFGDVRSVVQAYRGLLEARPLGQTFNVCSGQAFSLREVIAECESIVGRTMDVSVNPAFVRVNEVKTLCGDPARLRSVLGDWQSIPLQQTLQWMLESQQ